MKHKLHLVGSGRRSEDRKSRGKGRKSREKVLYYLSVLWLFHFTKSIAAGYYVNGVKKKSSRCSHEARRRAKSLNSYYQKISISKQGKLVRKKLKKKSGKKLEVSIGQKFTKKGRKRLLLSWLIGFGSSWKEDWLQKKECSQRRPGCRR